MSINPIQSSNNSPINTPTTQEENIDLDAILDETLGELDLNDKSVETASSIPLPDTSYQANEVELHRNFIKEMFLNSIQAYRSNPEMVRSFVEAQVKMQSEMKANLDMEQPRFIIPMPGDEEKSVLVLINQLDDEESTSIFESILGKMESLPPNPTPSLLLKEVGGSYQPHITRLIQKGKARILTAEEQESMRSSELSSNEINERLGVIENLGLTMDQRNAIVRHERFEVEMSLFFLDILSKDEELLTASLEGLSSINISDFSLRDPSSMQSSLVTSLLERFTLAQKDRFYRLAAQYLLERLQIG